LESLPAEIGNLTRLRDLDLRGNKLKSLPASVRNLAGSMRLLDLRNNPDLEEYGAGDTLGWRPLREIFGDHVLLPIDCIRGPPQKVGMQEVYERIRRQPLHWNVAELRKIREDPAPEHTLGMDGMLGLFRGLRERLGMCPDEGMPDGGTVEEYIRMLYGSGDADSHRVWAMYEDAAEPTKNMLEALLRKMVEKMDQHEADDVRASLLVMTESMKHCPDGQTEGLRMAYRMLYGAEDGTGTFGHFVRQQIACLKSWIFDATVMPGRGTQNVHVLTHWRYELRDELGLAGEFVPRMGTMSQDMFGGHPGNVLEAFYEKFTPLYVAGELAGIISGRQTRMNESGLFLMEGRDPKDEKTWEYLGRVFEFENEQGRENMDYRGIRDEGVVEILLKMGLLKRNEEARAQRSEDVSASHGTSLRD